MELSATKRFLARIDVVERRLNEHARLGKPTGLTKPDPATGEQWDAGQVWSHLGEIIEYWIPQAQQVVTEWNGTPVPFGRKLRDPGRLSGLEERRSQSADAVMSKLSTDLASLRSLLLGFRPEDWEKAGLHPHLGVMSLEQIVEKLMVGHLEEHAEQLDQLRTSPR